MATPSFRLRHVLCPTDFSDFSERALRHAVSIARARGGDLTVVHVSPYPVPLAGEVSYDTAELLGSVARAELLDRLRAFTEPAVAAGVPVRSILREGHPSRQIARLAEELPADLLVLGTHGRSGFERMVLGSVTDELLVRATCPVLTVCHSEDPGASAVFPRILCATDLGCAAGETVMYAVALAEACGAELTVLHVLEGATTFEARGYSVRDALRWSRAEEARQRLRSVLPPEAAERIAVQALVAAGRAHEQILRTAREEGSGLIVLGPHAHSALGRLLFGSTAHHVVREATCPVLSVRALASQQAQAALARRAANA